MNSTYKVVFNKARGALMVVNEVTSSVQNKGSKTVIAAAIATLFAGTMLSSPAMAGDGAWQWDLKTDGILEKNDDGSVHSVKLIGGDYIGFGPTGNNAAERYGSHYASDGYKANIDGDAVLNLGKEVLTQRQKELANVVYQDEPAYISIIGGGVVYGSSGSDPKDNSANVNGNVKINISDYTTENTSGHGALDIRTASVESCVGLSNISGNVEITLNNVHAYDSDIQGGGNINGDNKGPGIPAVNAEATIGGNVTIKVENSLLSYIDGGGDASARPNVSNPQKDFVKCDATVKGNVTIDLKNTVLDLADYEKENHERSVLTGGGASENGSVADVLGGVEISLRDRSSVDLIIGGGCTASERYAGGYDPETEPEFKAGASAKIGKDVSITLDNSSVNWLVIAGGMTDESFYWTEANKPEFVTKPDGDAAVYGNTFVTLRNGASVNDVYMAGYGKGTDVKGGALLTIEDADVKVTGVLHGQGHDSTTQLTTLAFGTADKAYTGDFTAKFVDFDVVTASKGSTVNLGTLDAEKHGRVNGEQSWLKINGEGEFKANLNLTKKNNLWVNAKLTSDTVKLDNAELTIGTGTLTAGTLDLTKDALLTVKNGGTLATGSAQVFTTALNKDGKNTSAGDLRWSNALIFEDGSTLTLDDAFFNDKYAESAYTALKSSAELKKPTLVFSGTKVDLAGDEIKDTGLGDMKDGVVEENTNITTSKDNLKDGTLAVDKTVGGQTLTVAAGGTTVSVSVDKKLTLAGSADGGELVIFDKDTKGDKKVTASGKDGGLTLGSTKNETKGNLSATVELSNQAKLTTQKGSFTVEAVKAADATIDVKSGELQVKALEVTGTTNIKSADNAKTNVNKLTFGANNADNKIVITGAVTAEEIAVADNAKATIHIGSTDKDNNSRGDLTVGKGSLKGLTFFLDPMWVDGQKVTDASRLVLNSTDAAYTLEGKIVVGHNSYVVIGDNNDAKFVELFNDGTLTWGGDNGTLAAAYIAKPVKVTTGALTVNSTLTTLATAPTDGSVTFAANSVLVADVSTLGAGDAFITAPHFYVADTSKAVVVGLTNGQTFKLASDETDNVLNFWNTEDTLVSGNKLIKLTSTDGTITAAAQDAKVVFKGMMQGYDIANAGTIANNAYVSGLVTDSTGKLSNEFMAARFDAAMNTAGAAAVFTTAYDRASEFRDAVRGEAFTGESNRLWAQAIGSKTKLKGISTGAQSLHVDTDAYGLAIGGDADLNGFTLGAAFTAGTGDSENKSVGVKDDFDFYGLSVYGKTAVGDVDILADASATWLKSDLTMSGASDVDTDTTTAVYSLGVQAQKTFAFAVDITPFIGVDVYHVRSDGYDNGHGARVEDSDATAVEFPIGATIAKSFDANGFKVSPNFTFAVVPTVGDRDIDSKVRFAGAESTYNFTFADDVKIRTNLGVAAEKDNFRFGLNAGYDWGNEERSATKLMLNARYLF